MKRCPEPRSTIPFICESKFSPFDSAALANLLLRQVFLEWNVFCISEPDRY